ncbi:MAG: AAA family ATPase [Acidimicrobiales bacterium]
MKSPLREPVERFVQQLAPAVATVALDMKEMTADKLRRDVTVEAFNLTAAFVDADGLHTDDELWALIGAFAGLLDTQIAGATPRDVRRAGLVDGKTRYLEQPSVLFDILVRSDARHRTGHARTYYERALEIAFAVASLDLHTARDELEAIERFRGVLLNAINNAGVTGPSDGSPRAATPEGAAAAAAATAEAGPAAEPQAPPRPLEELLAELDELIGLDGVKKEVKLVANLIQVERIRKERKLPVLDQSRHLVFTGNPGTGKTTVARLLAQIYRTLGVVEKGHLVETDRSHLVAGYVGQTAIQVRQVFDDAEEGVLLVDEAYSLMRGGERDFGREAIDTIVKLAEDRRDSVVVIVAGYPQEMQEFLDFNPGMRSRFPRVIFFPDYTNEELVRILEMIGKKGEYRLDPDARRKVLAWFEAHPRTKGFGNGRLGRNLFEVAVTRQASRLVTIASPTNDQLVTFVADDIPDADEAL